MELTLRMKRATLFEQSRLNMIFTACFFAYGFVTESYPILAANASVGTGATLLICAKLWWRDEILIVNAPNAKPASVMSIL